MNSVDIHEEHLNKIENILKEIGFKKLEGFSIFQYKDYEFGYNDLYIGKFTGHCWDYEARWNWEVNNIKDSENKFNIIKNYLYDKFRCEVRKIKLEKLLNENKK